MSNVKDQIEKLADGSFRLKAFRQGMVAFVSLEKYSANPHRRYSLDWYDWQCGWKFMIGRDGTNFEPIAYDKDDPRCECTKTEHNQAHGIQGQLHMCFFHNEIMNLVTRDPRFRKLLNKDNEEESSILFIDEFTESSYDGKLKTWNEWEDAILGKKKDVESGE